MNFDQLMQMSFMGNLGREYLKALIYFAVILIVLKLAKSSGIAILRRLAKRTKNDIDDMIIDFISQLHWPFLIYISLYASIHTLILSARVDKFLNIGLIIFIIFYATRGLGKVIEYVANREIKKRLEKDQEEDTSFVIVLSKIVKFVLWVIAFLFALANFGINITPLITGLGIGGIAIAFALQNILEDLFSSFTLYFDKPFKKGDVILIGQDQGEVKHIGLKTTRVQTLQGEELIVSNRELTTTRVRNFKHMEKRRVLFTFGVEYKTPGAKLKKINEIVTAIIKKIDKVEFERVHFKSFSDYSLIFEVVYHINTSDYKVYMDIQQMINMQLKEQLEKEKIEMAFPTQNIYLKK